MTSTPVPGFITKKDAAERYQRSHRQLTRDLSDAMKVQDPKVLDSCRLRTEDGEILEGLGLTPEIIDRLCIEGKNPVWYLQISWLEKIYGRRGRPPIRNQGLPDEIAADANNRNDGSSRPELIHILRERIESLERDKQDLRDEMKIKNQQIADRVEREKETNALIRDLHTLMADSQRRLLPPPTPDPPPKITEGFIETDLPKSSRGNEEQRPVEVPLVNADEKGSRQSKTPRHSATKQRRTREKSSRTSGPPKPARAKNESNDNPTPQATKSRSLWSRLFPR